MANCYEKGKYNTVNEENRNNRDKMHVNLSIPGIAKIESNKKIEL